MLFLPTWSLCFKKYTHVIIILKSRQRIKNKDIASGFSLSPHCSFDATKNKLDYYKGKDYMKIFCKDLKEHVTKIINYEKTEMIPLTIVESKSQSKILLYMPKKF